MVEFPATWRKEVCDRAEKLPAIKAHPIKTKVTDLSGSRRKLVSLERGGVCVEKGLDEGHGPNDTTLVLPLTDEVFEKYRGDFDRSSNTFGIPEVLQVRGSSRAP